MGTEGIGGRKYCSALDFSQRLLASEAGDHIAKIVLFGSVLHREATEESDVDLMIIALDDLERVKETAWDLSFDILMEWGEGMEPIVHCIGEWRFPPSYLIYKVKKEGKEIHGMEEKEIKWKEGQAYLRLAEEYLDGAKRNMAAKDLRIAIDAAYNAAELCAKALLLLRLDELPKTHRGVVSKLGELYVKEGPLPRDLGRGLNTALGLRNQARYEPHMRLVEEEARSVIELAEGMLHAASSVLEKTGDENK